MTIKYIDRKTGEEQIERPPGEGFLKFLYHNPFGQLALGALVKRKFLSSIYGRLMSRSNSRKKIAGFVKQFGINMEESVKRIEEFTSFNDFFYRKLKPDARPVQEGIVSPGDGKVLAFESIDAVSEFFVKGSKFTLNSFLQNAELAKKFENSAMFIIRLAPNDYHRFHFPYEGITSDVTPIRGNYFSVSPYALQVNFTRVFCENKREYMLLKTADKGDMLLSPVGATMVGTIVETYTPNSKVQKGEEMGYFAFGGSSVVMLVERDKIQIDGDLLKNTKAGIETFVQMGERLGI